MKVYWREHRTGQRLILDDGNGREEEVGGVRRTPRGFDALAKTMGYDPGRAQKGFATMEEAKAFVEKFEPWEIFVGSATVEFDRELHPMPPEAGA